MKTTDDRKELLKEIETCKDQARQYEAQARQLTEQYIKLYADYKKGQKVKVHRANSGRTANGHIADVDIHKGFGSIGNFVKNGFVYRIRTNSVYREQDINIWQIEGDTMEVIND